MQIRQTLDVIQSVGGINKEPGKLQSIFDVGAATAPLPTIVGNCGVLTPVATAVSEVATATGLGNGVSHPC